MKHLIEEYQFSPESNSVVISDSFGGFCTVLEDHQVLIITNVTRGVILYLGQDPLLGGAFAHKRFVVDYDCSSFSKSDVLQIFVDIPEEAHDPHNRVLTKQLEVLTSIDHTLRKIEFHLSLASDHEVQDKDIRKS